MGASALIGLVAMGLCLLAIRELVGDPGDSETDPMSRVMPGFSERAARVRDAAMRLGLEQRIARAGWEQRLTVPGLMACKGVSTLGGILAGMIAMPAAPGRLSWVVALGMPVAGFMAPDALLEREARRRLARLRSALPDALDLIAVGAAAGRAPLTAFAEIASGKGPLAVELGVTVAEADCGVPQSRALQGLRQRVPGAEVAMVCAAIERSQHHGSPLADQLRLQSTSLRASQRRRIEEQAAKAAPKIQLVVALLLVPSVLLMIAAGLIVNADRFLVGF